MPRFDERTETAPGGPSFRLIICSLKILVIERENNIEVHRDITSVESRNICSHYSTDSTARIELQSLLVKLQILATSQNNVNPFLLGQAFYIYDCEFDGNRPIETEKLTDSDIFPA
jgi:hypothetical protein